MKNVCRTGDSPWQVTSLQELFRSVFPFSWKLTCGNCEVEKTNKGSVDNLWRTKSTPFSQSFELNLKHCFQLSQKKKYRLLRCNEGTTSDLLEEKICVKAIVRVLWCIVAEIITYLWRNVPSRALQSVFELFQFYRRLKWFFKRFIRLR